MKEYAKLEDFDLDSMHLLWFAPEDEGRTEDATEHKIRKSREEGKVAKSQELSSSIVLLFTFSAIIFLASYLVESLADLFLYYINFTSFDPTTNGEGLFLPFIAYFLQITLPIFGISMIGGIVGNLVQVGFLWTTKPLAPDLKKIIPNFPEYLKKSFFGTESLFNLAKALVKVIIVASISYLNIMANIPKFGLLYGKSLLYSLTTIAQTIAFIFMEIGVIFLVLAIIDYYFQRRKFLQSLKMTKHEVKEERKTYEGDPLIKSRIKQRMQEILKSNMIKEVPKADVVITNPTHYAVALQYNKNSMTAPTVIAKGQDNMAFRIRDVAKANGIPVMEDRFLARSIYADVEIGEEIPEKYYEAVVLVLREVYRMNKNKNRAW